MSKEFARSFLRGGNEKSGLTSDRKRRLYVGIAVLLVIVIPVVITGASWLHARWTHVEENDARIEGEVTTIASRLDGWLMTRPVMEGDRVTKGQVLAEIDTRDAKLRLAAVEGNLAAHRSQIEQITLQRDMTKETSVAQVADAKAELSAAEAAEEVAKHQQDIARSDFDRNDPLVKDRSISEQTWDHTHSKLLQAEAALQQAQALTVAHRAALTQAIAQLGQTAILNQQIEVLRGETDALSAQADQIRQEIQDRTLRAPYDGIIDRTFIHPGDYVQAGQWLMMMHDPADIWVEAAVKETAIGSVRVGQKVKVTVDAYPDLNITGKVLRVGNAATNQFALLPSPNPSGNFTKITQRVPVRIAIDKPARELQPGLMVEVSIDVSH